MARKFGKKPARRDYRTLRLKDYLTVALPAPPPAYDAVGQALAKLGLDLPTAFPMDGNDTYGDCTCAAVGHAATMFEAAVGNTNIPTIDAVVALYQSLTGGPDTGLDELTVLNHWRQSMFSGVQITAYASIDPKNHDHVKQAIQLFDLVYVGLQVPADMEDCFEAGRVMGAGALTQGGHAVIAVAYDDVGPKILTWGGIMQMTWACWDDCVDEAYALLPDEAQNPAFVPGVDFTQLQADLTAVTA